MSQPSLLWRLRRRALTALRDRNERHLTPEAMLAARRQALARSEQRHGHGSWQALVAAHNLANWFREAGRPEEALPLDRELSEACRQKFGDDDRRTVIAQVVLATTLADIGAAEEAEGLLERAVNFLRLHEGESADCADAMEALVRVRQSERGRRPR
ncbi:MAG TPA: tetratricopeptide repeat protein [Acidimicrobiales bacterium]|nr:tetratricopeptide repeat protein [Acidimicrobiales bacterium]